MSRHWHQSSLGFGAKASPIEKIVDWRDALERWLFSAACSVFASYLDQLGTAMAFSVEDSGSVEVHANGFDDVNSWDVRPSRHSGLAAFISLARSGALSTRGACSRAEVQHQVEAGERPSVFWLEAVSSKRRQLVSALRERRADRRPRCSVGGFPGGLAHQLRPALGIGNLDPPHDGASARRLALIGSVGSDARQVLDHGTLSRIIRNSTVALSRSSRGKAFHGQECFSSHLHIGTLCAVTISLGRGRS